jgi:hypothetical protein
MSGLIARSGWLKITRRGARAGPGRRPDHPLHLQKPLTRRRLERLRAYDSSPPEAVGGNGRLPAITSNILLRIPTDIAGLKGTGFSCPIGIQARGKLRE